MIQASFQITPSVPGTRSSSRWLSTMGLSYGTLWTFGVILGGSGDLVSGLIMGTSRLTGLFAHLPSPPDPPSRLGWAPIATNRDHKRYR